MNTLVFLKFNLYPRVMGGTIGLLVVLIFLIIYEIQGRHHHGKKTDNDNPCSPTATATRECDVFKGKWVYHDSKHYPLYTSKECPFIEKVFNCQNNGRPDSLYLNYKWQPSACNLPRFNGKDFLRRFKGKRIMFVGDSLSLNQWQSLTCLLHASVPRSNYTLIRTRALSTFTLPEYNVTVMLSRNAFLVDIVNEEKVGRALKLDSISSGKQWSGIDTLIFDTWHWWLHTGQKQPWDIIEDANATYKDMDRMVAFEKGLSTWASWVDSHVHPSRTKVFFQGVSPDHAHASDWGGRYEKDCKGEQEPVVGSRGGPHPAEAVVERVVSKMKTPIYLLNITAMSQLRKDGHPSVFGFGARQRRVISRSVSDCSHWCLPGVPDIWNQLLYVDDLVLATKEGFATHSIFVGLNVLKPRSFVVLGMHFRRSATPSENIDKLADEIIIIGTDGVHCKRAVSQTEQTMSKAKKPSVKIEANTFIQADGGICEKTIPSIHWCRSCGPCWFLKLGSDL